MALCKTNTERKQLYFYSGSARNSQLGPLGYNLDFSEAKPYKGFRTSAFERTKITFFNTSTNICFLYWEHCLIKNLYIDFI